VDEHKVGSRVIYDPLGVENFLDLSATIPPLYQAYEGEADFTIGYLNSNIKTAYREEPKAWDPLLVTETLDVAPWVTVQEIIDYDLNGQSLTSAESVLKLFKLRDIDQHYTLEQELLFEPGDRPLARTKTQLHLYGFRSYYLAEKKVPVEVDLAEGEWDPVGSAEYLLPSEVFIGYQSLPIPLYMWKNRIRLDTDLSAGWTIDLHKYTDSIMEFSLALNLSVYKFLDLTFSVTSFNTESYRYIPAFAKELDEPWISPFTDIARSFNFFNIRDRYASSFNLKSVSLLAVHHLGDWDLSFEYAGEQVLETQPDGSEQYVWTPIFSIILQWKPIPEIRKEVATDPETDAINWRGTRPELE